MKKRGTILLEWCGRPAFEKIEARDIGWIWVCDTCGQYGFPKYGLGKIDREELR
jgi:hypothetical protein